MAENNRNKCRTLKCRKCRLVLLQEPRDRLMDIIHHGPDGGEAQSVNESLYNVYEDQLPQWISDAVEEGGWTKGKLSCPSCKSRVGGFDFITSSTSSPVYITRSKVDLTIPGLVGGPCSSPSVVSLGTNGADVQEIATSTQDLTEPSTSSSSADSEEAEVVEEEDDSSEHESNTESDHAEASKESSSTDEDFVLRTKKQTDKRRRRRKKKEMVVSVRVREDTTKRNEQEKKDARMKEILESQQDLNILPDDVICPVCLDLLHEPFQVEPCGHIFCEPCLRRLGQKNPMNCSCPLCRTKIGFCKHLAATSREIREEHEKLYLKRKKFERSTPVFTYPLPWQPGWRNLLRGRPLGGNRFVVRDNRAEYFRAILHQIPFYIPPVMIANLINIGIFAFMMGFIEVFPNLLTIFFGSSNSSLPLNSTGELETSGDLLPGEGEAERGIEEGDDAWVTEAWNPPQEGLHGVEALDSTFYYILFTLSVLAAALGQFLVNHELQGPLRVNRITDLLLVVVITVLPLLLLPAIMPYRTTEGTWFGGLIEKSVRFLFSHINYHTAILLGFTAWFVYHVDVNEDLLW